MGGLRFVGRVLAVALIGAGGAWTCRLPAVAAQDATPDAGAAPATGRPVQIRAGSCDQLGEVVVPLTDLTKPTGDDVGQAGGMTAETSLTNVPLTLDQILASDHAISAARSPDENEASIACGNVGGVVDANRALVIGLLPQDASDLAGVAYLSPGVQGGTTDVSVFLIEIGGLEAGDGRKRSGPAGTPDGGAG